MLMTFQEYIQQYYNVTDRIKAKLVNPIETVKNADWLPYDDILYIDGELQKVVFLTDDEPISVLELISYTAKEIADLNDPNIKLVWENYMECIDVSELDIQQLLSAAQTFMSDKKRKRAEQMSCIQ